MLSLSLNRTHALAVTVGVALLAASAKIQIPIQPVPITLQPTMVMILGLFFNRRAALHACLAYLVLGGLGLPIFAAYAAGNHVLIGPSAGYLFGFVAAVWVMGFIQNPLLSVLSGTVTLYACGVLWLSLSLGLSQAFAVGVLPFIIPGMVKSLLLAGIAQFLKH